jgi:multiple sugar transport system permease protein
VLLTVGAASMIYPFMLMLSGSMKSEADAVFISPLPRFWFEDEVLFQKYVESKYNVTLTDAEAAWGERIGSWRSITAPPDCPWLKEYLAWRGQCDAWHVGHTTGGLLLPINARLYRREMYERFDGEIDAYRQAMRFPATTWNGVMPPPVPPGRYPPLPDPMREAFDKFAVTRPLADRIIESLDGEYWRFLTRSYTNDIAEYNRTHGTAHRSYDEVLLATAAPAVPALRNDWEEFVRELVALRFVHMDPSLAENYRKYLSGTVYSNIGALNEKYGSKWSSFEEVTFPTTVPDLRFKAVDWAGFLRDRKLCPIEKVSVAGPRQAFEQYVAKVRGLQVEKVAPLRLPIAQADYHDCMTNAHDLRWEFSTRNYKHVLEYILLHGRGVTNTLIYCALTIVTSLLVNPLAAYALSRYRPPSTYKILLLCMATMAFPGEVTMIPAFLLRKRFPLWPILAACVAFAVTLWLLSRFLPRLSERLRAVLSVGVALVVGVWMVPQLVGRPYVSLLNTFSALVLPGMANGFFIFLLKGFFDSLPKELYEAADLDGASEWTKFWTLTMGLSTPILAVIALGAFTGAYSAFMMALIIIPDPDMWTLMVWIFQLQTQSHQGVVYAAIVLAAIPTFIVFVFCQNIIIKGIVVPTEK